MVTKYNKGIKSITDLVIHITENKKESFKIIMSYSMVTLIWNTWSLEQVKYISVWTIDLAYINQILYTKSSIKFSYVNPI